MQDGHIVEIGESMAAVVWRFYQQGLSLDRISEKSSMPPEFVKRVIKEHVEAGQESGIKTEFFDVRPEEPEPGNDLL